MTRQYVAQNSFAAGALRKELRYRYDLDLWRHAAEEIVNFDILPSGALKLRPAAVDSLSGVATGAGGTLWEAALWRIDGTDYIAIITVDASGSFVLCEVNLYDPATQTIVASQSVLSGDTANLGSATGFDFEIVGPSLWVAVRRADYRPSVVFWFWVNFQSSDPNGPLFGDTQPAYREVPGAWQSVAGKDFIRQTAAIYGPWMPAVSDRVWIGTQEFTVNARGWTDSDLTVFSGTYDPANGYVFPAIQFTAAVSDSMYGFPIYTAKPLIGGFKDPQDTAVGTAVTFFEQRLVVAGADTVSTPAEDRWNPLRLRMSRIGNPNVLVPKYAVRSDSAIEVEVWAPGSGACLWAKAGRDVAFFGYEHSIVALRPNVSPETVAFNRIAVDGVSEVPPVVEDNTVYFVTADRSRVAQLTYDFFNNRYRLVYLDDLAPEFSGVTGIAVAPPTKYVGKRLFLCNGTTTVAVGYFDLSGKFIGWTQWEHDGPVDRIVAYRDQLFFLSESAGDIYIDKLDYHASWASGTRRYDVVLSPSRLIVAKLIASSPRPLALMAYYPNRGWVFAGVVYARDDVSAAYLYWTYDDANAANPDDAIRPSDLTDYEGQQPTQYVAFVPFDAHVTLMPPITADMFGVSVSRTYREVSTRVEVADTMALRINDIEFTSADPTLPFKVPYYTGFWRAQNFRYNEERSTRLEAVSGAPLTILGVVREVEVS